MQRGHDMGAQLRGDVIQAKCPGEQDDEKRGEADGWVDADDHTEGEAPGQTARCDAAAHQTQQGAQDIAAAELADGFWYEHT